jgi:hypothetical protein
MARSALYRIRSCPELFPTGKLRIAFTGRREDGVDQGERDWRHAGLATLCVA